MDKQRIIELALESLANQRAEIELEIEAIRIIRASKESSREQKPRAARRRRKRQ